MDHLRGFGLAKIGVGHCTGTRAFVALSNEFPNRVFLNTVGNVVSVTLQICHHLETYPDF